MRSMDCYPKAPLELAMKVQDVMLQAMAKKITWRQAAEILGISDRHMRRWRERYVEEGYNGLFDRRRGKRSRRRVAVATVERVFALWHLSRMLCLRDSCRSFEARLKHGIELVKSGSDVSGQGSPLTLLEGRDGEAEFEF